MKKRRNDEREKHILNSFSHVVTPIYIVFILPVTNWIKYQFLYHRNWRLEAGALSVSLRIWSGIHGEYSTHMFLPWRPHTRLTGKYVNGSLEMWTTITSSCVARPQSTIKRSETPEICDFCGDVGFVCTAKCVVREKKTIKELKRIEWKNIKLIIHKVIPLTYRDSHTCTLWATADTAVSDGWRWKPCIMICVVKNPILLFARFGPAAAATEN